MVLHKYWTRGDTDPVPIGTPLLLGTRQVISSASTRTATDSFLAAHLWFSLKAQVTPTGDPSELPPETWLSTIVVMISIGAIANGTDSVPTPFSPNKNLVNSTVLYPTYYPSPAVPGGYNLRWDTGREGITVEAKRTGTATGANHPKALVGLTVRDLTGSAYNNVYPALVWTADALYAFLWGSTASA